MTERFDTGRVTPDELAGISHAQFRAVVDADLRRRVRPDGISKETSEALRSPAYAQRWLTLLEDMRVSVEGQMAAAKADYETQQAALEADIKRLEGTVSAQRLERLFADARDLRNEHMRKTASRERFLTGVKQHLLEATDAARAADVSGQDGLERRVSQLVRAIEIHRKAVLSDLDDNEEPEPYEEALWAVLAASDD